MTATALATAQRPSDHHEDAPLPDPLFGDNEFGGGTWEEFQDARRRYLRAVSHDDRDTDSDQPHSQR
jgi:hypothetical protein